MDKISDAEKPRSFENAEESGDYVVITKVSQTQVDPLEKLNIQIFFSGYGIIENPKISFYPSNNFFVVGKDSRVKFDIGRDESTNLVIFGVQEKDIPSDGVSIDLNGGLKNKSWKKPTLFFDDLSTTNRVVTEGTLKNPPVELSFLIDKKARPGRYTIRFVFTYFNGEKWCTSFQDTEFSIRNVIQRHETSAWILAILAAIVTIMPFLIRIIECIYKILNLLIN